MTIAVGQKRPAVPDARTTRNSDSYSLRTYSSAEKLRKFFELDAKSMAGYLGIDEKTYYRRAQSDELKGGESLKIEMLEAVLDDATRVLRSKDEARHWILTPIISLDHKRPLDHLSSINGYERVKNTLIKIEYGMY